MAEKVLFVVILCGNHTKEESKSNSYLLASPGEEQVVFVVDALAEGPAIIRTIDWLPMPGSLALFAAVHSFTFIVRFADSFLVGAHLDIFPCRKAYALCRETRRN